MPISPISRWRSASVPSRFENGAKVVPRSARYVRATKRSCVRSLRFRRIANVAAGTAERIVDRAPRRRERDPAKDPRSSTAMCAAMLACPRTGSVGRRFLQCDARHLRIYRDGNSARSSHPPAMATFEDGYRANCIVEAILESAKKGGVGRASVTRNDDALFAGHRNRDVLCAQHHVAAHTCTPASSMRRVKAIDPRRIGFSFVHDPECEPADTRVRRPGACSPHPAEATARQADDRANDRAIRR